MKKSCVALCMISLLMVGVFASSSYSQSMEDIVAIWLFDEGNGKTASDSVGGHHGDIIGSPVWVDGQFGKALQFPGTQGDYVSVSHKNPLTLSNWTITAWVKVVESTWTTPCQIFMRKADPGNIRNYSIKVLENASRPLQMEFTVGAGVFREVSGTTQMTDDNWHHIAGTYDQSVERVYLDGVMEGEVAYTDKADTNTGPLTIGASFEGACPVNGVIDDVGLFKRALKEGEIAGIMNNGLAGLAAVDATGKLATTWAALKELAFKGK
ncbi:LamG domain-containing protein [Candidatus Poribacteria bacterium]